jgi:hypothetical protein
MLPVLPRPAPVRPGRPRRSPSDGSLPRRPVCNTNGQLSICRSCGLTNDSGSAFSSIEGICFRCSISISPGGSICLELNGISPARLKLSTMPCLTQHKRHFVTETFEVAPADEDADAILPYWWMAKRQHCHLFEGIDKVEFNSPCCQQC